MKVINTETSSPMDYSPAEREWVYNGLDCCVTSEVLDALLPQLDNHTTSTYGFSRELQGPVLDMRFRGVRIDYHARDMALKTLRKLLHDLEASLDYIVDEALGMDDFNWRSNPKLQELFYDYLKIPPVMYQGRPTLNRSALEKMEAYTIAAPFIKYMKAMRDVAKKISFLQTEIDPDGRIRTDYRIAGTSTGRLSSSFNEFGSGTNLQNVEEGLRSVFIADEGMKLAKFDAKSGESYCVGAIEWNLFRDGTYLDACESGDPHTAAARICWPNLAWTGDIGKDKKIAEQLYYRDKSYRYMCKKIGHGSNYGGKPRTLSDQSKIPIDIVTGFQRNYFGAFPAHQRWHHHVAQGLRRDGYLISLMGRKHRFLGRRDDDKTLREALACDPQGSLADYVNKGMLKNWKAGTAQVYLHDHDALTYQYPEEQEDEIIPKLLEGLKIEVPLEGGRPLIIPYDCVVGWNKGKFSNENPDGLREYDGYDPRKRTSFLDRT